MADMKCKAESPLQPNKKSNEIQRQLKEVDEGLYQLMCTMRFYHSAIQALFYQADKEQTIDFDTDWQFGSFLIAQWTESKGQSLTQQIEQLRNNH